MASGLIEFLSEEKKRAEQRIHSCETFLNDPNLTSNSLREGLASLLQSAEDDFGTLLHLEKCVNMKNSGDSDFRNVSNLSNKRVSSTNLNYGQSLPATYGFASYMSANTDPVKPRQTKIAFANSKKAHDEFEFEFDEDVDVPIEMEKESIDKPSPLKKIDPKLAKKKLSVKEEVDEEEDEDLFDENAAYPAERLRQRRLSAGESLGIARSLPVSVPIHKLSLPQKEDDDQDDFGDIADIPNKIAELARSVHGGDIFGDLPSPRREQQE